MSTQAVMDSHTLLVSSGCMLLGEGHASALFLLKMGKGTPCTVRFKIQSTEQQRIFACDESHVVRSLHQESL